MMLDLEPFDPADYLTDPESIAIYLTDALETGKPEEFIEALGDVTRARGGVTQLASETGLAQQTLQGALDSNGHPDIRTILKVLQAFGIKLTTSVADNQALAA